MNEQQADAVAEVLGGNLWQSGGGTYLILLNRKDGRLVVISDDAICEYESEQTFDECKADKVILLH